MTFQYKTIKSHLQKSCGRDEARPSIHGNVPLLVLLEGRASSRPSFLKWMAGVLVVVGSLAGTAAEPKDFYLKDGDRVVMLGDSLTESTQYADYLELWTRTRFPAWKVEFWKAARSMDMTHRGAGWFDRDVVTLKPTVLTVCMGFNDGVGRTVYELNKKAHAGYLASIGRYAKQANIDRVAWLTHPPMEMREDGAPVSGNENLGIAAEVTREHCAANSGLFVDLYAPYLDLLTKVRANDLKARLTGPLLVKIDPEVERMMLDPDEKGKVSEKDRAGYTYAMWVLRNQWKEGMPMMPGPAGSAFMAATALKAMSFPSLVSAVEIDAAGLKTVATTQCTVSELKAGTGGGMQFLRQDSALPYFPESSGSVAKDIKPASELLKWSSVLEEMNDYRLKVTGLKPGKYEIRMDGERVAEYTAEKLGEGVNLAAAVLANGPIAAQVKRISEAVAVKNKAFQENVFKALMPVVVSFPDFLEKREELTARVEADKQAEFNLRMQEIAKLEDAIRKELVIKPHVVAITPAGDAD
jgi:hypothetical protein